MPDPHFAAYSFVDRIDAFEAGRGARASFAIPGGVRRFSAALVAEAVGQLAAWVSMEHIDFRGRPVAGLATETRFHDEARPGDTLTLVVDLLDCDDEAVAYNGHANVGERRIIELVDCLGPMLPVADFDAPEALRERLALLRGAGARPGRFEGIDELPVRITHRVAGAELDATLDIPADAPFFADHFPRRPVFPATLLLDMQMQLALALARESAALADARPVRVTHVKMRSFILPSQRLSIGAQLTTTGNGSARAMLTAKTDDRLVASARLELASAAARMQDPSGANAPEVATK